MRIVPATAAHAARWAEMRGALWPDAAIAEHRAEIDTQLDAAGGDLAAFVALDEAGIAQGFVEAAVRRDYVNGCDTSPVAFLEGLYTAPPARRRGIARALVAAVADWAGGLGLTELASDADITNVESHRLHQAIGFAETERVVFFRHSLSPS